MGNSFNPQDLWEIINQTQVYPEWVPYSEKGEFDYGHNRLIAPEATTPSGIKTLAHELTHAISYNTLKPAARALQDKKWQRQTLSSAEARYLDAMQKIHAESFGRVGQASRRDFDRDTAYRKTGLASLFQDPDIEYRGYRTSPEELLAFGVGGTVKGGSGYGNLSRGNPHLNPTAAQEFSILLDLYKRLPDNLRKQVSDTRRKDIEESRKANPWSLRDLSKDMQVNPFNY